MPVEALGQCLQDGLSNRGIAVAGVSAFDELPRGITGISFAHHALCHFDGSVVDLVGAPILGFDLPHLTWVFLGRFKTFFEHGFGQMEPKFEQERTVGNKILLKAANML